MSFAWTTEFDFDTLLIWVNERKVHAAVVEAQAHLSAARAARRKAGGLAASWRTT